MKPIRALAILHALLAVSTEPEEASWMARPRLDGSAPNQLHPTHKAVPPSPDDFVQVERCHACGAEADSPDGDVPCRFAVEAP